MKVLKSIFTVLFILVHSIAYTQTDWRNREHFTPRGDLHILFIFTNQECDRLNDRFDCLGQTCADYYYTNSTPAWPPLFNQFFKKNRLFTCFYAQN